MVTSKAMDPANDSIEIPEEVVSPLLANA